VWRSWVYVSDNLASSYDFFFKVDDDTLFLVPTMREVSDILSSTTSHALYLIVAPSVFRISEGKTHT
jgi:hypothetical protein